MTYPKTSFFLAFALVAAAFATTVHLKANAPYVVENTKTEAGVHLVIKNPRRHRVVVTIHCGGTAEYDESHVTIFPNTLQTIDVETTPPADSCNMVGWEDAQ